MAVAVPLEVPEDPEEIERLRAETLEQLKFANYIKHFKILDRRTGQLVPFVPNRVQLKLRVIIEAKLAAGEPVRIWVLKSRRMGVSTIIQATYAHLAFTKWWFTVRTGAHEQFASSTLHNMTELMYKSLPEGLRVPKETGLQGKVLAFTTGSSLTTFTAKSGDGVGRSTAARAVHASELAYWDDPAVTMASLRQTVPSEPNTFVIGESTANGVGDFFHHEWQRAKAGESGYEAVFFGWFEFDDYRMALDDPLIARMPGLADRLRAGELDPEEVTLVESFGVDLEQLAWRYYTWKNECGGDLDTFHQEYPATDTEAFLSSGRPFFTGLSEVPTDEPRLVGEIAGEPIRRGQITFTRKPGGRIRIWEVGRDGHKYVIGADCAGSVILKEYDARPLNEKADAFCAYVVDVESAKTVASFHARGITEKAYARELAAIGYLFNKATIAVEKQGGYGTATIIELRDAYGYPHIYEHLDVDSIDTRDETGTLGFPMTTVTRPLVLEALDVLLRETPACLVDVDLIGEMRTFVTNKAGKHEADTGCHDDRVMARAIAAHIRNTQARKLLRAPLTPEQIEERRRTQLARKRRAASAIINRAPRWRP